MLSTGMEKATTEASGRRDLLQLRSWTAGHGKMQVSSVNVPEKMLFKNNDKQNI